MSLLQFVFPQSWFVRQHPLYVMERQRLNLRCTLGNFIVYNRIRISIAGVIIIGLWLFTLAIHPDTQAYGRGPTYEASASYLTWLIVAGIGGVIFLDLACVLATIPVIARERQAVLSDLLRLTNVHPRDIVTVWHTVIQLRVWRFTLAMMCLRGFTLIVLLLHGFVPYTNWSGGQQGTLWGDLLHGFSSKPFYTIASIASVGIIVGVYLLEPLWRMRAVAAIGTAVSLRMTDPILMILASSAVVIGMWLMQGVFGGMVVLVFLPLAWTIIAVFSHIAVVCGLIATDFVFLGLVYFLGWLVWKFYAMYCEESLRRAGQRVFLDAS